MKQIHNLIIVDESGSMSIIRKQAFMGMNETLKTIRPYVDEFIAYAQQHPEHRFLVTRIGCGIAGFTPEDIAPLFAAGTSVSNIALPEDFWEVLR